MQSYGLLRYVIILTSFFFLFFQKKMILSTLKDIIKAFVLFVCVHKTQTKVLFYKSRIYSRKNA